MKNFKIKNILLIILFTVVLIFLFVNISTVFSVLGKILAVIMPVIYGLVIAYILNYPYKLFYDHALKKMGTKRKFWGKFRKPFSLVLSYVIVFGIIAVLLLVLIPELSKSMKTLVDNVPLYAEKIQGWINDGVIFVKRTTGFDLSQAENYQKVLKTITGSNASQSISDILSWLFPFALNTVTSAAHGVYNWSIGIIISIYLIGSKDKLLFSCRKIIVAYLPRKASVKTLKVCNIANNKCGKFIIGKIIDSMIIGLICFVGMTIFRFDYAVLISVTVTITNLIPFFGPFLGAIPSAILLFIVNPWECLWFVIFIILLQQFDGNILGPRILGDSVGISGFWIMVSVIVGGGLFGVVGMLLGVPVFAVIYTLVQDSVNTRLKKKALASQGGEQLLATEDVHPDKPGEESE